MSDFNWLKENCKFFLDENIKSCAFEELKKQGFKVESTSSIGYSGANDGKLLTIIKERKEILVTFDKRFSKMSKKYNKLSILLVRNFPNQFIGGKQVVKEIKRFIDINYKKIREYYDTEQILSSKEI